MSGEPAGMVYPSGLEVTYSRDASGRISGIAVDGQPLLQNITYNPFGPIANYRIANSLLTVDRTYDLLYRLEHAQVGSLYDLSFDSDAAGQVFAINDHLNPASGQSFDYDSLDRLTSADGIYGSIGYSYDAAGNRQTRTSGTDTDSYTYVAGSNRLAAITGSNPASYTYDAHGNMIGNGVFTFAYDQANRLSEVWNGETLVAEYGYDGRNLRVKKDANGMVTYYHYEPQGKLIAETDDSGSPLRDYIYLGDEPVAVKVHGAQAGISDILTSRLSTIGGFNRQHIDFS